MRPNYVVITPRKISGQNDPAKREAFQKVEINPQISLQNPVEADKNIDIYLLEIYVENINI